MMTTRFYKNSGPIDHLANIDAKTVKGKTILITGASSGLGAAFAKAFIDAGAFVVNGDVRPSSAEYDPSNSIYVKCDACSWDDQVELFKRALESSPTHTIDVVIANAGIYGPDIFDGIEEDEPTEPLLGVFNVDLFGVIYTAKLASFYFLKQKGLPGEKSLILLSSIMGYIDSEGSVLYATAKHAVRGLMVHLRRKGVMRVNSLAPWFIPTPGMHPTFRDSVLEKFKAQGLEFARAEDAAAAAVRISSDPSINGRAVAIIPRQLSPTGFIDLNLDDFEEGTVCGKLQKVASSVDYPGVHKY